MKRREAGERNSALVTFRWLGLCAAVWMMIGQSVFATNDDHPSVSGDNDLDFGTIYRNSSSTVGYNSSHAARFTVTGRRGKDVTLIVTATGMLGFGGSSNLPNRVMTPTLSASACEYSTDGGSSWHAFSSVNGNTVSVSTRFRNGSSSTSTILVRVGGVLTSLASQQRGSYYGVITLHADYDD